jgi:transposase InsO family protein
VNLERSSYYYEEKGDDFEKRLLSTIHKISRKKPRYGYRRMHDRLRALGWKVNRKRIQRLMREEGLKVVVKAKKRRRLGISTSERKRAQYPNHVWSWDIVFDRTEDGRAIKTLGILDEYTRMSLTLRPDRHITSVDVIEEMEELIKVHGAPEYIRSDNGPEFIAKALNRWLKFARIGTIYITPGSPWENPYIESFFGKFRDECLNRELFTSLNEARVVIEEYRKEYNEERPHSSLGYMTPARFAASSKSSSATLQKTLKKINNGVS